jgi:hypothetical protein
MPRTLPFPFTIYKWRKCFSIILRRASAALMLERGRRSGSGA